MTNDRKSERLTCHDFTRKLQTDENADFCFCNNDGKTYSAKNITIGKNRITVIIENNNTTVSAFSIDDEYYADNIISLFGKRRWKTVTVVPHVEFVSYTGDYPHLCGGTLTLKIDGEEYKFGNSLNEPTNHPKFWKTGGSCGFSGHNSYVGHDEWIINPEMLPEEIRCYADKIAEIFNENVEHGCCGGCL